MVISISNSDIGMIHMVAVIWFLRRISSVPLRFSLLGMLISAALVSSVLSADAFAESAYPAVSPSPTGTSAPVKIGCYSKKVSQSQFSPSNYPESSSSSPFSQSLSFKAALNSLEFKVHMPVDSEFPYVLDADFSGFASVCTKYDATTKQYYDDVTLTLDWAYGSGGVYNVFYAFTPYMVGYGQSGSRVTKYTLYYIDAAPGPVQGGNDCLRGAAVRHNPYAFDEFQQPRGWPLDDEFIRLQRLAYSPTGSMFFRDLNELALSIADKYRFRGERPMTTVLGSHGHTDIFGFVSGFLQGNNASVQALSPNAGKIRTLIFESCCSGKGKSLGMNPNLLDSVASALTPPGGARPTVCGWNHQGHAWMRYGRGGGGPFVGHTAGDALVCVGGTVETTP